MNRTCRADALQATKPWPWHQCFTAEVWLASVSRVRSNCAMFPRRWQFVNSVDNIQTEEIVLADAATQRRLPQIHESKRQVSSHIHDISWFHIFHDPSLYSWVGPMSILFHVAPRKCSQTESFSNCQVVEIMVLPIPCWGILRKLLGTQKIRRGIPACHTGTAGTVTQASGGIIFVAWLEPGKPGRIWSPRERTWLWNTRETKMDKIRTLRYLCRSLPFSALRMEFSSWAHKHQTHFFWHRIGRIGTWSKSWWQGSVPSVPSVRSVRSVRAHFLPQRSKERSCNTQALQRYQ